MESSEDTPDLQPQQPGPHLVRRIVCSYQSGILPGEWLQTWRRLDRLVQREGLRIKVLLAPLDDLPEDVDLLVVPPELREAAESTAPGIEILSTTPSEAAFDFAVLVQRLQAGLDLTAEKVNPAEQAGPTIVTYRGSTRLD